MKYTYAYKTSDGARHEDSMEAESREAVFAALRAKGIKAIKVVAADGSKANGEVNGAKVAKTAMAIVGFTAVASVLVLSFALYAFFAAKKTSEPVIISTPRHQIYGDPATMEGLERGDFAAHLPRVGDRMLAVFAQPGKLMCARGANPRRIDGKSYGAFEAYAKNDLAVENDIDINSADSREITELKQIVNGMREEMREYLANGNGTPRSFWRRLNERTEQEIQIYERTRRELEKETSEEVWEQKNDALRRLGLRTIPNPNE